MQTWQITIGMMLLSVLLVVAPGCASQQYSSGRSTRMERVDRRDSPIPEDSTADKVGQATIAVLLVLGALASIAVPILLLL